MREIFKVLKLESFRVSEFGSLGKNMVEDYFWVACVKDYFTILLFSFEFSELRLKWKS